ncbi:MAG: IS3 family transposase [Cytophagaceae bacterium]|nr:MAG: IS3 family transposase [Cytophagaceae bacterium]
MRFAAIERQSNEYRVFWMCKLLDVSRSSFYQWRCSREKSAAQERAEAVMLLHIKAAHKASRGAYGSPRIHRALAAQGLQIGRRRVERLMREACVAGRTRRKFTSTTRVNEAEKPAENIMNRDFVAAKPNTKWVTDITYLPTKEGFVYLAAIIDLFSNHVVGFSLADHMRTEMVLDALQMAVSERKPAAGLLHHSDRGSQYTSKAYQEALAQSQITCSMSRKGECWDNACAESLFGRLKEEIGHKLWETKQDAIDEVQDYITRFYNPTRIQKKLGFLSPVGYELREAARQRAA